MRAFVSETQPDTVVMNLDWEAFRLGRMIEDYWDELPVVATDTPELATWFADAINATIEETAWEVPRPRGSILRRGYFEYRQDESLVLTAYGYTKSTEGYNRFSLWMSEESTPVQSIGARLNGLIGAEPPQGS